MTHSLNIAIAGLGTVGGGVAKILHEKPALLTRRTGCHFTVTAVSARNKNPELAGQLPKAEWLDNAVDLAKRQDVDLVVELIGGADGIAYDLCKAALQNKKHVVTANKALIAKHGVELAKLAEQNQVTLAFEAAVAGGIPALKAIKEGLAANEFSRISGILNGTCNYILTAMRQTERDFAPILQEAQQLGYAEADPSFDIDGIDTAHKLAILTSLAYGAPVNLQDMYIEGIRHITLADIHYAEELGMRIKLLGICEKTPNGIKQRVHPCMLPAEHPAAKVDGVLNAVIAEGDSVGRIVLEGRGAGSAPTASAVVADIMDIALGRGSLPLNVAIAELKPQSFVSMEAHEGAYYMRLVVVDRPGVLADITDIFREHRISLESFLQKHSKPNAAVQVVITTHVTQEAALQKALQQIQALDSVVEPVRVLRIEGE